MTTDNTDTRQTPTALPAGTFWMFDRWIGGEELAEEYATAVAEAEHLTAGTT